MSQTHADEPLQLSVHSMPQPGGPAVSVVQGRLKLLAILVACVLPVLVAYFVFHVVRPQGSASLGQLITPVVPMPALQATRLDGNPVPLVSLKAQWLLVKVDGGACDQTCQKRLVNLRQLRLMFAKDMDRIDWIWLISDQAPVNATLAAGLAHDSATVLRMEAPDLAAWMPAPEGQQQTDFIYVVDPMGNTMMRFPADLDSASAAKAKRDLTHLLRASTAWDPAGRPNQQKVPTR